MFVPQLLARGSVTAVWAAGTAFAADTWAAKAAGKKGFVLEFRTCLFSSEIGEAHFGPPRWHQVAVQRALGNLSLRVWVCVCVFWIPFRPSVLLRAISLRAVLELVLGRLGAKICVCGFSRRWSGLCGSVLFQHKEFDDSKRSVTVQGQRVTTLPPEPITL